MRFLLFIGNLLAAGLAFGQSASSSAPKLPEPLSPAEAAALDAKEKKEHDEAMARLPMLTEERLKQILDVIREIRYPIRFDLLREKLGGSDSMVWCCTRNRVRENLKKQTSTYFIAGNATDYELVVDFEDSVIGQPPTMVGRVRLCYNSPLGWRFEAESWDDLLNAGAPEEKPNQSPEPMPLTRHGSP